MIRPAVIQISDRSRIGDEELLRRIARGGPSLAVQLRDPELPASELLVLGKRLREATRAVRAALVVNDRIDLALLLEAEGLHLGRRSVGVEDARRALGPAIWLSRSAHHPDEALANAEAGAQASLLSPIFASPGKGQPLGLEAIREARARLDGRDHAIYALGGVDAQRLPLCLAAGAEGVAAIGADLTGPEGDSAR